MKMLSITYSVITLNLQKVWIFYLNINFKSNLIVQKTTWEKQP